MVTKSVRLQRRTSFWLWKFEQIHELEVFLAYFELRSTPFSQVKQLLFLLLAQTELECRRRRSSRSNTTMSSLVDSWLIQTASFFHANSIITVRRFFNFFLAFKPGQEFEPWNTLRGLVTLEQTFPSDIFEPVSATNVNKLYLV